ncbi:MAG: thioredoxin family protein [bacterium]
MVIRSKIFLIFSLVFILSLSLLLISFSSCKNKRDLSSTAKDNSQVNVSTETKDISQTTNKKSTNESGFNVVTDKRRNKLPKLIDLGADKCIPCKMMKPILESLKEDYAGKLEVDIIDVWENPKEGEKYNIRLIPTQIFYDPDGNEFYRHEGFLSREDIINEFERKGIKLD